MGLADLTNNLPYVSCLATVIGNESIWVKNALHDFMSCRTQYSSEIFIFIHECHEVEP